MKDLSADVRRDIKDTLFTADTELFLDKIFPSGLPVDQIFKKLREAGVYADGYWKHYPYPKITPQNESLLYKPFARILNAIVSAIPKKASNAKEKSDGKKENDPKIIYVDRPNKAPRSVEESMARGRPDGAGAQPDADIEKLDSTVTELLGKYQTRGTTKALEDLSKENDRL
ncbi:hypothetical protein C0995_002486, partial [Termitomyces sp. Mi166